MSVGAPVGSSVDALVDSSVGVGAPGPTSPEASARCASGPDAVSGAAGSTVSAGSGTAS
ncbi:Uncharacterised protein [Mycobacteroides abscessus]|nr:Uncharacterised protein [Mycobacteroides abscessus]